MNSVNRKIWAATLCLMIALSIATRLIRIADRNVIFLDESLTYLAATGHWGEYNAIIDNEAPPIGHWVPASEWQRLIRPEDKFSFFKIRDDLSHFDVHPPLYFWLMHLWVLAFGTTLSTGLLFNLACEFALIGFLLWAVYRKISTPQEMLLVSAAYALNPVAIQTFSWIRQYMLLALLSLLFVYSLYEFVFAPKQRSASLLSGIGMTLITLAGLLTHYYFALVIGAGLVACIFCSRRQVWRQWFGALICVGSALVLFTVLSPNIQLQLSPSNSAETDLAFRLKRSLFTYGLLFSPIVVMLIAIIVGQVRRLLRQKNEGTAFRLPISWLASGPSILMYFFIVVTFISLTTALMYLTGTSPPHAMAAKYVHLATPFVALASLVLFRLFHRQDFYLVTFYIGMIVLGGVTAISPTSNNRTAIPVSTLNPATPLVIDNLNAGVLFTIIYHLDSQQEVFVGSQPYLLSNQDRWLERLRQKRGIYASVIEGPNSNLTNRDKILSAFGDGGVTRAPPALWETGDLIHRDAVHYQVEKDRPIASEELNE
jgi:uncharacterized membrane protein